MGRHRSPRNSKDSEKGTFIQKKAVQGYGTHKKFRFRHFASSARHPKSFSYAQSAKEHVMSETFGDQKKAVVKIAFFQVYKTPKKVIGIL